MLYTWSFRNARSASNINMSSSESDDDDNNKLFQNNFSSNSNSKNRSVSPGNIFYHFEFQQLKNNFMSFNISVESIFESKSAKKDKESNFTGSSLSSSQSTAASNKVSFNLPQLGVVASNNKVCMHSLKFN